MLIPRVIPILLVKSTGLVKGINFKHHKYIGDPLNAVRIFNTKEVDELALIDITATKEKRAISPALVRRIANECLMPLMVGGGITSVNEAAELLAAGAEKLLINSSWIKTPSLVSDISKRFGCQSVVVAIDAKKNWLGNYQAYTHNAKKRLKQKPRDLARIAESLGAGEILITSIDHEGQMRGYDIKLTREITEVVNIPVIAAGGAGQLADFEAALSQGHCSAVAASSFFVFHGARRAVLISYPNREELEKTLPYIEENHAL